MKGNNRQLANIVLCFTAVGYVVTYPFHSATFVAGLFNEGFGAGMIGGLADSFAVTSLFRNPLGIRWPKFLNTKVIPRNRERLFQALTDMVQNELLTPNNIKGFLKPYDITAFFLRYIAKHGGRQDIKDTGQAILEDIIIHLEPKNIGTVFHNFITSDLDKRNLSPILFDIFEWTMKHGYDERLIQFLIGESESLLRQPEVEQLVSAFVASTLKTYSQNHPFRKVLEWFVPNDRTTEMILNKIREFIIHFKSESHPLHKQLRDYLHQLVQELRANPTCIEKIESWKSKFIQQQYLKLDKPLSELIEGYQEAAATGGLLKQQKWNQHFDNLLDKIILQFETNHANRQKLSESIKQWIFATLTKQQSKIGGLVRESLEKFSNEMLIEFIETRAGNDLQLIRVNGSLVGGLVGILLYLMTSIIK